MSRRAGYVKGINEQDVDLCDLQWRRWGTHAAQSKGCRLCWEMCLGRVRFGVLLDLNGDECPIQDEQECVDVFEIAANVGLYVMA